MITAICTCICCVAASAAAFSAAVCSAVATVARRATPDARASLTARARRESDVPDGIAQRVVGLFVRRLQVLEVFVVLLVELVRGLLKTIDTRGERRDQLAQRLVLGRLVVQCGLDLVVLLLQLDNVFLALLSRLVVVQDRRGVLAKGLEL